MPKQDDEIETADYKTTSSGRKVRAHRIVFNKGEEDHDKLKEESMTDEQKAERERIVKGMKKNYKGFVAKYGKDRAKSVMYATATKNAMKEESEIEEELKGNQHKLDKNKNGKLDKHDFKLLRKEESEQLDELSKDTVSNYKKRASDSWIRHASDVYDHEVEGGKKAPASTYRNLANRKKGYARADARLNKEEFDHEALDKKYGKPRDASDQEKKAGGTPSKSHSLIGGKIYHWQDPRGRAAHAALKKEETMTNKQSVLERVYARMNKEEVEQQLDEATVASVAKAHGFEKVKSGFEKGTYKHPKTGETITPLRGGSEYGHSRKDGSTVSAFNHKSSLEGHLAKHGYKKTVSEDLELDEAHPFDIPKSSGMATSTATKHDVKKTPTGTMYTKQRDADGMAKEFKRDPDEAKRGRGRPKKNSFSEAAEFLMSLDEEMFDELMAEGFDAFAEEFEKLDELSKTTLGNYIKKAANDKADTAFHRGYSAYNNSNHKPYSEPMANKVHRGQENRNKGIKRAVTRLTK